MRDAIDLVPLLPNCTNDRARVIREVVPRFPAVAVVLHRAKLEDVSMPWREIAKHFDFPYDPTTFWAILVQRGHDVDERNVRPRVLPPRDGCLSLEEITQLLGHLHRLDEPDFIHKFVWTAYGFGADDGELVRWCGDTYVYTRGSLDDIRATAASPIAARQTPNMWIPDSGQWAVISHRRCLCTYVAGPEGLAGAIAGDPKLDAALADYEWPLYTEEGWF